MRYKACSCQCENVWMPLAVLVILKLRLRGFTPPYMWLPMMDRTASPFPLALQQLLYQHLPWCGFAVEEVSLGLEIQIAFILQKRRVPLACPFLRPKFTLQVSHTITPLKILTESAILWSPGHPKKRLALEPVSCQMTTSAIITSL